MRTIKFRAWNWGKVSVYEPVQFEEDHLWSWQDVNNPNNNFVLMQYTGLHDKNGKEIYEGDIISGYYAPHEVKMKNIGAEENGTLYAWNIDIDVLDKTEVIGNIYENPELI